MNKDGTDRDSDVFPPPRSFSDNPRDARRPSRPAVGARQPTPIRSPTRKPQWRRAAGGPPARGRRRRFRRAGASPPESAAASRRGSSSSSPRHAYPRAVTRGLYGGPLWLDMQGLQWPYTPQTGIGLSGYGWIDNNYRLTRSRQSRASSPNSTELLSTGAFPAAGDADLHQRNWFVQAQAEFVANKTRRTFNLLPASSTPTTSGCAPAL